MQFPKRMRFAGFFLLACVCLTAGPATAQAPPLGEVARKEQERRKATPAAGKLYTNKDLPATAGKPQQEPDAPAADGPAAASAGEPAEPAPGPGAPASPQPHSGAPVAVDEPGDTSEAAWRQRMDAARESLRRSQMFADALETRINSLSRDYLSRDDPAQRVRLARDRREAIDELARVKQDIERARKQIAEIEEEGRKAGVPPGWLR